MQRATSLALGLTLAVVLVVAPCAGAFSMGADVAGMTDASRAGSPLDVAQIWIGAWTNGDYRYLDAKLADAKARGVTPQVQWYYWGNDISQSAVKYGKNGKSTADWNADATSLAKRIRADMGDRRVLVVLETEFNKNGVESWAGFNDYLAKQVQIFRTYAPNAKLVLGFGSWSQSKYYLFKPTMTKVDYAGFQMMKASTRNTLTQYLNTPNEVLAQTKLLKQLFGKPVLLFDLALSTYGGWDWAQKKVVEGLAAKRWELKNAGLAGITLRSVRDDPKAPTWDYFGAAEAYFGLKRADGSAKSAWWTWVWLAKNT